MPYNYKSPSHMPNFGVFWDEDTNPAPKKESTMNKSSVILWNPTQPECGPVYHVVVNFTVLPMKVKCLGAECDHCKVTQLYTKYLREREVRDGE